MGVCVVRNLYAEPPIDIHDLVQFRDCFLGVFLESLVHHGIGFQVATRDHLHYVQFGPCVLLPPTRSFLVHQTRLARHRWQLGILVLLNLGSIY